MTMRVERASEEEDPQPYTVIRNPVIDDDLSCRALGLLIRWLRRPADVPLDSIPDMVKWAKRKNRKNLEGRDALYAASHELEQRGYLVRRLVTNKDNQHEYVIRVYSKPVPLSERSDPDARLRSPKKKAAQAARAEKVRQTGPNPPSAGTPVPGNPDPAEPVPGFPDSGFQEPSLKESRKGLSSSSSGSSADAPDPGPESRPLRGPDDDDDENGKNRKKHPLQHKPDNNREDLEQILDALTVPHGVEVQGPDRNEMIKKIGALRADGWTREQIKALFAHDSWDRIKHPHRFLLSRLGAAVGTRSVPTLQERTDGLLEALRAARARQKADIAVCTVCGPQGRIPERGWHGHGDEDLTVRIWELECPEQAANIAELNAQSRRVA